MVDVGKVRDGCFIVRRVALELCDPVFDAEAKTGADFEAFTNGAVEDHGGLPELERFVPELL